MKSEVIILCGHLSMILMHDFFLFTWLKMKKTSILGMTDLGANLYYVDKYNKTSFSYTIRYFAVCDCPDI